MYMRKKFLVAVMVSLVLALFCDAGKVAFAQIPGGQDVGSLERSAQDTERQQGFFKQLWKGKKTVEIKDEAGVTDEPTAPMPAADAGQMVRIDRIIVQDTTLVDQKIIREIVAPFEGKELSLDDFREVADLVTDAYRSRGYATSIAYILPQRVEANTLVLAVAEGLVGNVTITGNKHFSSKLLQRYLDVRKGEFFNYDALRSNIDYINQHQDRNASVVLARGEGRGETDVEVQVKDRIPLHATVGYNNYNSRYLHRHKAFVELKSTNFLWLDHLASVELQRGEGENFQMYSTRYLAPITPKSKLGFSYMYVDQELWRGDIVKDLEIKGTGNVASVYYTYKLYSSDNFSLSVSPGFDYKNMRNKTLGDVTSEDYTRVAKLGFDMDYVDFLGGRTILTHEFDMGIKDILGGLGGSSDKCSRAGSGAAGDFFRTITHAAHIQPLPASLALMLRGSFQFSADPLVSSEQFNIGGVSTVRGYPVAEKSGDRGGTASIELYVPPYFLPKDKEIPFTNTTYFDSLRFVGFIDYGRVMNKNPLDGEYYTDSLRSTGAAIRFDIPGRMTVSFDYGFVIGQRGSDGAKSRGNIEVKMFF